VFYGLISLFSYLTEVGP